MKLTVVATIAIWATGIGSAAALVNTLARPPVPKPQAAAPVVAAPEAPPVNIDNFKIPAPAFVAAPAKLVRSQLRAPAKPAKQMKCTAFGPLQFGPVDQGVRVCKPQ